MFCGFLGADMLFALHPWSKLRVQRCNNSDCHCVESRRAISASPMIWSVSIYKRWGPTHDPRDNATAQSRAKGRRGPSLSSAMLSHDPEGLSNSEDFFSARATFAGAVLQSASVSTPQPKICRPASISSLTSSAEHDYCVRAHLVSLSSNVVLKFPRIPVKLRSFRTSGALIATFLVAKVFRYLLVEILRKRPFRT